MKHTDSRWIADSTLKASYLKPEKPQRRGFKLYSRSDDEASAADSLKRLDSLRIADSIRVADSILVARYQKADVKIENEKKAVNAAAAVAPPPSAPVTPATDATPKYVDNLSARTITIAPDNPFAGEIDSLQAVIDQVNDSLHDADYYFKKMKLFPTSERQRYISYLLTNNFKDSTQILVYLTRLFDMYKIKQNLLIAIRNSQDVNTKSFISYHLEEHLRKMGELSDLLLSFTPNVPFVPERNTAATGIHVK
ncbi:MAG: hypothetical protein JW863_19710 [Chitinispirillaceae bacterium]|nr:hypothetical protein [Chitinispirillaceae bacterium]